MSSDDETVVQDWKTKEKILDTLAKYGDSLLDDDCKGKQKKKRKRKSSEPVGSDESKTTRKRRKKKKGARVMDTNDKDSAAGCVGEEGDSESDQRAEVLHGERRHLAELKQKLGLTDFLHDVRQKQQKDAAKKENEALKCASNAKGKRPPAQVVVFEDPAKRNWNKPKKALPTLPALRRRNDSQGSHFSSDSEEGSESDRCVHQRRGARDDRPARDPNLFDMRRAKHDVQMFGITGMQKTDKEKAKLEVMMRLGAKPPKNVKVNYRELQVQKKKEKADRIEQRQVERAMGNKVSKSNNRKQRQRDFNDVGHVDGQVGRYKAGAQILSKHDIHKVKGQGGRKWKHR